MLYVAHAECTQNEETKRKMEELKAKIAGAVEAEEFHAAAALKKQLKELEGGSAAVTPAESAPVSKQEPVTDEAAPENAETQLVPEDDHLDGWVEPDPKDETIPSSP